MKRINRLLIVGLVALLMSACSGAQQKAAPTPQSQQIIPAVVSASASCCRPSGRLLRS